MLSYNVAELMRSTPGTARVYSVEGARFPIAEDLELASPVVGQVRLTRTGRSIMARARLNAGLSVSCSRCLAALVAPVEVEIEEEALPSIDFETGQPLDRSAEPDALRLDDHHELDLHEPVREALSLAEPIAPLCREACRGLCVTCGADLNSGPDHGHDDDEIDPRLAALAAWGAGTNEAALADDGTPTRRSEGSAR